MNIEQNLFHDSTPQQFATTLADEEGVFKKIFQQNFDMCNLSTEELDLANEKFNELKMSNSKFEQMTLEGFINEWKKSNCSQNPLDIDDECQQLTEGNAQNVFEVRSKRMLSDPRITRPTQPRGRHEEFDAIKFIVENVNGNSYPLCLELDQDWQGFSEECYDDDENGDLTFEEKSNRMNQTDHNLRRIARLIMTLNQKQERSGYKILDIYNEKRIYGVGD